MSKYRKKPVVIDAYHFASGTAPMPEWLVTAFNSGAVYYQGGDSPYITIRTLEGDMRASFGDYIIKGVKGEIYPCKPDIFEATYEPVEESL